MQEYLEEPQLSVHRLLAYNLEVTLVTITATFEPGQSAVHDSGLTFMLCTADYAVSYVNRIEFKMMMSLGPQANLCSRSQPT